MSNLIPDTKIPEVLVVLGQMYPEAACALDHGNEFELLISVVLSAQTTDVSVNKVTPQLFAAYPDPESLAAADRQDVERIIRTIGLYRNKSANIIKLADRLMNEFNGVVPGSFDDLVSLPGVGRKTANVVLAEGFGEPRIAVDTHVFRVSNRIGLSSGRDVTEVEETLMARIPRDEWIKTHHMLIFHGRRCCTARNPHCEDCGLGAVCANRPI